MANEKKLFRETRVYPIIFMLIITAIFIGILATFYQFSFAKVQKYRKTQLKKMVMGVFEIPTQNIENDFPRYITIRKMEDLIYYEYRQDSILMGYCFPISGSGLWGTIHALLAVTRDFGKIINIEIVDQNETPGLGGRITESWFKDQFKGKILIDDNILNNFMLISENEIAKDNEIKQITGATASSKALVDMIYEDVKKYNLKLRADL
ncbi:MAG: FMN-binding protein [Candidatus Tenebribacter burtonii]|nr:FMN-binding protein [Candidatus Tenebribacter burtonii]